MKDKTPVSERVRVTLEKSLTIGESSKSEYTRLFTVSVFSVLVTPRKKVLIALPGINTLVKKMAPHNTQAAANSTPSAIFTAFEG